MAVLGGGITGVSVSLALAERGVLVDLFEQSPDLISQASYANEGKLHLGFVYAQDNSRRTARTMIEGAIRFRPVLSRWIEDRHFENAVSDPFIYAVHRDTLVPVSAVDAHFRAVDEIYADLRARTGGSYIGPEPDISFRRQTSNELESIFDTELVDSAFQTMERSIDPLLVANELRRSASSQPSITSATGTTVLGVEPIAKGGFRVTCSHGGSVSSERYETVVNALWQNRLAIDETVGIVRKRPVLHRYKVGLFSKEHAPDVSLPTVTFMLGAFGDTVRFRDRAYLSWYPAGLLHTSGECAPPSFDDPDFPSNTEAVEPATLEALGQLIVSARDRLNASAGHWDVKGGYITAWGRTGLEDVNSELHQRYDVGVFSAGAYHSINTGKYTLGPHFAEIAADRICPGPLIARPTSPATVYRSP